MKKNITQYILKALKIGNAVLPNFAKAIFGQILSEMTV